ncbi:type IV pilin protein [Pseudorhodoferax sp. Leaf265]|jgi:type IV pilus assembly protein PilE|uniref:type IV pilin protein n=1 Tax=Pseudorhodoferax sp. Leaf265 TaxID=1736315 RepID=UPI0006FBBF9A|nr:type IV pilin protein [Pseudorhodoferax sp. Leaf265]KQP05037.1 fimbrial protein [Pseudorhodoferax sp. Leaf265]
MTQIRLRRAARGFTLIEMMITVAIAGILVAVALPNYTEYVRRGARAEARAALLQAAQWMERSATASGRYPLTAAFPVAMGRIQSGRYTITLASPASAGVTTDEGRTFTLTATPAGAQAGDKCGNFTLTHTGVRGVSGTESVQNCWSR